MSSGVRARAAPRRAHTIRSDLEVSAKPGAVQTPFSVVEHSDVTDDICSRLIVRDPHYRDNCPR